MICWPGLSIPLCRLQLSLPHWVSSEPILQCYLPIFSAASLVSCHFLLCLEGWSLQGLRIWWCVCTTSVCALWQWRAGNHMGWWLGWSFAELPHLSHVECVRYPWVLCSISSPCSVIPFTALEDWHDQWAQSSHITRLIFLSFHMGLIFASEAVVWAILARTSRLDPSLDTIALKYLKLDTVSRACPLTLMSEQMPLLLVVIIFVFPAWISIP